MPRAAISLFALRDNLGQRNLHLFLEQLILLFRNVEQLPQFLSQARQARRIAIKRELTGDRGLSLGNTSNKPTQRRILFVERKLFDDDVDLLLNICTEIAVLVRQLGYQSGKRAFFVIERKLFQ